MRQGKVFYEQWVGGKTKYTVNYHDGKETHKDGSPFYGMKIFKNKQKLKAFIKTLKAEGYQER